MTKKFADIIRDLGGYIRPSVWGAFYACLLLSATVGYFQRFPLPAFGEKLLALGGASATLFSAYVIGWLLVDLINRFSPLDESLSIGAQSQVALRIGLGLGVLASAVLLLGWLCPGSLSFKLRLLTFALMGLFAVGAIVALKSGVARLYPAVSIARIEVGFLVPLILAALGMGVSFLACFSPITYYDSLVYHLALPSLYNQFDAIRAVPFNLYSFFPENMEMIFLYVLNRLPEPEYVINLIGWSMSLLVGLVLFDWGREIGGARTGVLAFMLWWTAPCVLFLSIGAYIDVPLAFFIFLSLRAFNVAMHRNWNAGWILIAGLFSGLACSTKFTGAICPILLFSALLFASRGRVRAPLLFSVACAVPFSLWLIKNAASVGNPFFPFFYKWFGGDVGWTRETASRYFAILTEYGATSNVFLELVSAPWRVVMSSSRFGGGFDVLGDFGWPLVIFGAPAAIFISTKKRALTPLWVYFLLHFACWFLTKPVLRFLIGALPIGVLLTAVTLDGALSKSANVKAFAILTTAPWLLSNLFLYFFIAHEIQPYAVSMGYESRAAFLSRRLPFYDAYEFLNNTATDGQKTLVVGEQRTYHLKVPFLGSNFFAPSTIGRWTDEAATAGEVQKRLHEASIEWVLVDFGEIRRLGGLERFGFSKSGKERFLEVLKNLELVKNDRNISIFRLR